MISYIVGDGEICAITFIYDVRVSSSRRQSLPWLTYFTAKPACKLSPSTFSVFPQIIKVALAAGTRTTLSGPCDLLGIPVKRQVIEPFSQAVPRKKVFFTVTVYSTTKDFMLLQLELFPQLTYLTFSLFL